MKTLRVYRVVKSFRVRDRILWAGDKIVLKESEAAGFVRAGDLEQVENTLATKPVWGERMTR